MPGVCFRSSADDSFRLSDGSSIPLKGHDNLSVEVKSTDIVIEPVKFDKIISETTQEVTKTIDSFLRS